VRVDAWTARYADRIITAAEALAKDLRDKYGIPGEKVLTIHNDININEMRPNRSREAIRDELGVPPGSPCLTAIGRMTQQKGFTYFLKALSSITRRFPAVRCFFVGDGPLRDELEWEASTLELHNNCQFTGMRTDIADILEATDIFIPPSL
jgi:glycosyltransferase involved in cell wall biosynthesis